eukprot:gnl/Chilomastix_cuspidata/220.p1 GENE.gnl/Chilomastix_cuspidata/220~~gnl/Chilomastix_cuspidata/220.p1  ORF type:complete len:351 (-),score=155.42 gnl/Chilomastix_cuspidata/220:798-1850(-)
MEELAKTVHFSPYWRDKEVTFNLKADQLKLGKGEILVDKLKNVEDSRSSKKLVGTFLITNLRAVWMHSTTNISIGFKSMRVLVLATSHSTRGGLVKSLSITCMYQENRLEFLFTHLQTKVMRLFTTMQALHRSYHSTNLYRDVKMRGVLFQGRLPILLPGERVVSEYPGAWQLSTKEGAIGKLFLTNLRALWHADSAESFTLSFPYLRVIRMSLRQTNAGFCIVLVSDPPRVGIAFRLGSEDATAALGTELLRLVQFTRKKPNFGVRFRLEGAATTRVARAPEDFSEGLDIISDPAVSAAASSVPERDVLSEYCRDLAGAARRPPVLVPEIGLAFEQVPGAYSVRDLWAP